MNHASNYSRNEVKSQHGMVSEGGLEQSVDELRRDVKTRGVQLLATTVDALFPEQASAPLEHGNREVAGDIGVKTFPIFGGAGAAAMQAEVRNEVNVPA